MARFGNILASLAMHSRSQRQQQYQYERDMERQLVNDAYRREQDAYARQADEERLNYDRMNNDRQYRFDRDKFDWQKQNADFLNRRLEENDNRAAAKRWADGLTPQDMQEIFRGPRSAPQEILEQYDADRPGGFRQAAPCLNCNTVPKRTSTGKTGCVTAAIRRRAPEPGRRGDTALSAILHLPKPYGIIPASA